MFVVTRTIYKGTAMAMYGCVYMAILAVLMPGVTGCPGYCSCGSTVICRSPPASSLATLLSVIPDNTWKLEITGASFSNIQSTDFKQKPFSQLNELKISKGQLKEIHDNAFTTLRQLRTLKLDNNQIYSISGNAFSGLSSLTSLDLSRNKLQSLSVDIFKPLMNIIGLDISYNNLADISNGLFSSQSRMAKLSIAGNKIGQLRGSSFQGTQSLKDLFASDCNIRMIDNDVFTKLSVLGTLDLAYNQLTSLPENGNLNLMRNLRNLTLQENKITSLFDSQFNGLSLDALDLSKNRINTVNPNSFMSLRVRFLDLSRNQLTSLPETIFQPVSFHLYSLKLNDNPQLASLPSGIFNGMQAMQDLNLSSCALTSLHDQHFTNTFRLTQIDISNNNLKSVPLSFIERAKMMMHVKLDNNQWYCDCNIKPLHDWLQYPTTSQILYCIDNTPQGFNRNCEKPKCSSPAKFQYRDISTLSSSDIETCDNTGASAAAPIAGVIGGIVAGIIVLAIIIALFIFCLYRRHKRGEPLLCGDDKHSEVNNRAKVSKSKAKFKRDKEKHKAKKKDDYYRDKKEKRNADPEIGSMNESDKSFVVRNYFHSMIPDPDAVSQQTGSMTRKDSQESLSQSGYGYGSRQGSRHSSQYSLNEGYKIESAV